MTAVLDPVQSRPAPQTPTTWRGRRVWNGFTPLQVVVIVLATIAPLLIAGSIGAALLGLISIEQMIEIALGAGENPGLIVFGAMFLASPVQWLTGRTQVRVRKFLGIVFFLLALSNATMFILEVGIGSMLSAPFLIAGTLAVVLAAPLFATSSRRSQRWMGMKRWRLLHKATYAIAAALLGHVLLLGEFGLGELMILLGFVARIPAVRRWLTARGDR